MTGRRVPTRVVMPADQVIDAIWWGVAPPAPADRGWEGRQPVVGARALALAAATRPGVWGKIRLGRSRAGTTAHRLREHHGLEAVAHGDDLYFRAASKDA